MAPRQKYQIPPKRAAIAPYNFVPLPGRVVPAPADDWNVTHDEYHAGRHTGYIKGVITTASPLYIRAGTQPADLTTLSTMPFGQLPDDIQRRAAGFFSVGDAPRIPGSSIRGLLRTLVEIVSFSKITEVSPHQRYFFRAVAATTNSPLRNLYRNTMRDVCAGLLVEEQDRWYVRPMEYVKVRQNPSTVALGIPLFDEQYYSIQYVSVSFTTKLTPAGRKVVDQIGQPGDHQLAGTLVMSGNMLETNTTGSPSLRQHHCVVYDPPKQRPLVPIDPEAVKDYQIGLTDFQKQPPFDARHGMLKAGRPVFYIPPKGSVPITLFGQSPNFRIPYRPAGSTHAASPYDFVPTALRDPEVLDIAESIFGFVRPGQTSLQEQTRAGRVFFSDARLQLRSNQRLSDIWESTDPIIPHILSSPKPTTFQHYLVQKDVQEDHLKHYASKPEDETVIRGHKLYWHQGAAPNFRHPNQHQNGTQEHVTQITKMKPVSAGVDFGYTIHFENLSDVELGALLWVLSLALGSDSKYRFSLGMGKPLGLGAISLIYEVTLCERRSVGERQTATPQTPNAGRYDRLFAANGWELGERPITPEESERVDTAFTTYVLDKLGNPVPRLSQLPRIAELLQLLSWPGPHPHELFTRSMEIERAVQPMLDDPNEYKSRRVLPLPSQVAADAAADSGKGIDYRKAGGPPPHYNRVYPETARQEEPVLDLIPREGARVQGKFGTYDTGAYTIELPDLPPNVRAIFRWHRRGLQGQFAGWVVKRVTQAGQTVLKLERA